MNQIFNGKILFGVALTVVALFVGAGCTYQKTTEQQNAPLPTDLKIEAPTPIPQSQDTLKRINSAQFDGCGTLFQYRNWVWFPTFRKTIEHINIDIARLSEGCYAQGSQLFIALVPGEYCESPTIVRYDIVPNILSVATLTETTKKRGCLSSPTGFGKRAGNIIKMIGSGGDAGCGNTEYFDYDFIANTLNLTQECSYCYDEDTGKNSPENCQNYE